MKIDRFEATDYYKLDDLLSEEHKLVRDAARKWVERDVSRPKIQLQININL